MRIKRGAKLRTVAGERIVMQAVDGTVNMTKVVSLNEVAAWLWEQYIERDFTVEDIAGRLVDEYGIEIADAQRDAVRWIEQMREAELIEQ